jgi:hypothetical protein
MPVDVARTLKWSPSVGHHAIVTCRWMMPVWHHVQGSPADHLTIAPHVTKNDVERMSQAHQKAAVRRSVALDRRVRAPSSSGCSDAANVAVLQPLPLPPAIGPHLPPAHPLPHCLHLPLPPMLRTELHSAVLSSGLLCIGVTALAVRRPSLDKRVR